MSSAKCYKLIKFKNLGEPMRKLVAGNWKMNGNRENLLEIKKVSDRFSGSDVDIVVLSLIHISEPTRPY